MARKEGEGAGLAQEGGGEGGGRGAGPWDWAHPTAGRAGQHSVQPCRQALYATAVQDSQGETQTGAATRELTTAAAPSSLGATAASWAAARRVSTPVRACRQGGPRPVKAGHASWLFMEILQRIGKPSPARGRSLEDRFARSHPRHGRQHPDQRTPTCPATAGLASAAAASLPTFTFWWKPPTRLPMSPSALRTVQRGGLAPPLEADRLDGCWGRQHDRPPDEVQTLDTGYILPPGNVYGRGAVLDGLAVGLGLTDVWPVLGVHGPRVLHDATCSGRPLQIKGLRFLLQRVSCQIQGARMLGFGPDSPARFVLEQGSSWAGPPGFWKAGHGVHGTRTTAAAVHDLAIHCPQWQ